MLHSFLIQKALSWVKSKGFSVSFAEAKTLIDSGEIPDVIAFRSNCSLLVECKTSYSDFVADFKKPFRTDSLGMGDWRFYFAPNGIIPSEKIPDGWGLIEVSSSGSIVTEIGVPSNTEWISGKPFDGNKCSELEVLVSQFRKTNR